MKWKLQAAPTTWLSELAVLVVTVTLLIASSVQPGTAVTIAAGTPAPRMISPIRISKTLHVAAVAPAVRIHATKPALSEHRLASGVHAPSVPAVPSLPPTTDCNSQSCIALSFDDGPSAAVTPQILTALEQRHIAATFFLIGKNIDGNQTLLQRMAADGFEVGNHSWSHPNMTGLTPDQIKTELLSTQAAIVNAGAPLPTLFRPPYGAVNDQLLADAGLQAALWNIDPDDWQSTDPISLAQAIIATAKPGGIVDLHDIHQVTADALPAVLDQLTLKGYKFVTVSQLLHSRDRPGNAPFYGYADPVPPTPL
jgi:peptidoglycan/xylan/chitin deacetylase (PgdA/CDA1 family)